MSEAQYTSDAFLRQLFELCDQLRDLAMLAQTSANEIVSSTTVRHHRVIKAVRQLTEPHPEGVALKEVAEAIELSAATTSELVETLVQRGILERKTCPDDRRAVRITLSEMTLNIFACGKEKLDAVAEIAFRKFSAEEKALLFRMLETMNEITLRETEEEKKCVKVC